MGYDDYSYGQVYAAWQAELREQAAIDALARRIRREQRAERRAGTSSTASRETVDTLRERVRRQLRARSS